MAGEKMLTRLVPEQFALGADHRIGIALADLDILEVKFISKEPLSGNIIIGLSFDPMKISQDGGDVILPLRESNRVINDATNWTGCATATATRGTSKDPRLSHQAGLRQTRVTGCHFFEEFVSDGVGPALSLAYNGTYGELLPYTANIQKKTDYSSKHSEGLSPAQTSCPGVPSNGWVMEKDSKRDMNVEQVPKKDDDQVKTETSSSPALNFGQTAHGESQHTRQIPRHICPQCDSSFDAEHELTQHLHEKHSGVKPWGCPYCGQRTAFVSRSELRNHQKLAHPVKCEQSIVCEECGQSFHRKTRLRDHKLAYHTGSGERRFVCTVSGCGKRYRYQRHLRRHEHSHGDPETARKYACDRCPLRFARRSQYKEHVNKHNGKKPFACSECDRSFTHSSTLWAHKKRHEETAKVCKTVTTTAVANTDSNEGNGTEGGQARPEQSKHAPVSSVTGNQVHTTPVFSDVGFEEYFSKHINGSVLGEIWPALLPDQTDNSTTKEGGEALYATRSKSSSLELNDFGMDE